MSFGLCHFSGDVGAYYWETVCHLGCVTCGCRLVDDCLSFGLCHFCVGVAGGWWVTVCHLGCVAFVLVWLPVGE